MCDIGGVPLYIQFQASVASIQFVQCAVRLLVSRAQQSTYCRPHKRDITMLILSLFLIGRHLLLN